MKDSQGVFPVAGDESGTAGIVEDDEEKCASIRKKKKLGGRAVARNSDVVPLYFEIQPSDRHVRSSS
jgi:hypothetical protein